MSSDNTTPAQPAPATPASRRRLWIILAVVGGLVLIGLVVALVVWRGNTGSPGAGNTAGPALSPTSSTPTPKPTTEPTPTSTSTASPAPSPTAPAVPLPTSCDRLYSPDMVAQLSGLALNPPWTRQPDAGAFHGTDDPQLQMLIGDSEHLTCVWASPVGASGSGIITNVVPVTPEQTIVVEALLVARGYDCYDQAGGRRCVSQTTSEAGTFGESHFLRNGVWLATKYTNAGPTGYTEDMIANLWPAG